MSLPHCLGCPLCVTPPHPPCRVVLFSQVWGILLREWAGASRQAILTNWTALGVISGAIAVIAIAAAL